MNGRPLSIALIEPSFPGRLGAAVAWLARRRGCRVWCFQQRADPTEVGPNPLGEPVHLVRYAVGGVASESTVPWTRGLERGICHAYGAWEQFEATRPVGLDLVIGRSARLGSALFANLTAPGVPVAHYLDGYLAPDRGDLALEDAPVLPTAYRRWRVASNAMDLLELESASFCWTSTDWQRQTYPSVYRDAFGVQFEGVDTDRFRPDRRLERPARLLGRTLPAGTKLVTFAARVADRLRGVDRFLGLANRLIRERSDVVCVVVGAGVSDRMLEVRYHGQDFADKLLESDPPGDPSRLWRVEHLTPDDLAVLLASSDLHVSPSRPTAIARTLVEAMAAGALILAVDGGPVREFLEPGRTGLIADPDDPEDLFRQARRVLDDPAGHAPIAEAASGTARERFSIDQCVPRLFEMLSPLVAD